MLPALHTTITRVYPRTPNSRLRKQNSRNEKMRINIRPAVPSDAPALAAINVDAFAGQSFFSNAFPNLSYEVIHHFKTTRYLQKIAQPRVHVLAAMDEDTGALVGCARWSFPATGDRDKVKPAERASGAESASESSSLPLPEGTNRAVHDGFFETLKEKAKSYLRDDDIGTQSAIIPTVRIAFSR
ncbi:hypothetical protein BDW71DRAFT_172769 [Aspergillus fruticulosus]